MTMCHIHQWDSHKHGQAALHEAGTTHRYGWQPGVVGRHDHSWGPSEALQVAVLQAVFRPDRLKRLLKALPQDKAAKGCKRQVFEPLREPL